MPVAIAVGEGGFGASVNCGTVDELFAPGADVRLRHALDAHGVLVFKGMAIDDAAQVALARAFGEIQPFGHSLTFQSANFTANDAFYATGSDASRLLRLNWRWHSDGVYRDRNIHAVVLRAEQFERGCGDTEFSDLCAVHAALPRLLQDKIADLQVEFSFEHMVRNEDVPTLSGKERNALPKARHKLVQELPDGRKALRLSPPYMRRVVGWNMVESRRLFSQLIEAATQSRFLYRHHWTQGDVIAWNNCWTMHRVLPYADDRLHRNMRGVVVLEPTGS